MYGKIFQTGSQKAKIFITHQILKLKTDLAISSWSSRHLNNCAEISEKKKKDAGGDAKDY